MDHTLRIEVIQALVRPDLLAGRAPLVWLSRPYGDDRADLAWATAVHAAGAELDVGLGMVAISKRSWIDPRTGVGRTWERPIRVR